MPKFTIDNEGTQFRIARAVHTLLTQIEDCIKLRPGLAETPDRVAKAYATRFSGYDVDIAGLFKTF